MFFFLPILLLSKKVIIIVHPATLPVVLSWVDVLRNLDREDYDKVDLIYNQGRPTTNISVIKKYFPNTFVVEGSQYAFTSISDYLADNYVADQDEHEFHLYTDDIRLWAEFPIFTKNNISRYNVTLSSDGTNTYVNYKIYKYSSLDSWKKYTKLYKERRSSYDTWFDNQNPVNRFCQYSSFAAAAYNDDTGKYVKYLFPEPKFLPYFSDTEVNSKYHMNDVSMNLTEQLNSLSSESLNVLYDIFDYNPTKFREEYMVSNKKNVMYLGSAAACDVDTKHCRTFENFLKMLVSQFPNTNFIYKPHPSRTHAIKSDLIRIAKKYNVKIFDSGMPAEIPILSNPDLHFGGSVTSTYMSIGTERLNYLISGIYSFDIEPYATLNKSLYFAHVPIYYTRDFR